MHTDCIPIKTMERDTSTDRTPQIKSKGKNYGYCRHTASHPLESTPHLCEFEQENESPLIARLLWNISDRSHYGLGGERVVELVRRLVYLRGYKKVSNLTILSALAQLCDFLYTVCTSIESSGVLKSSSSFKLLDPLLQSLNAGCNEYFIEPPFALRLTTLVKFPKGEAAFTYPLLKIDMSVCREAIVNGASAQEIQYVVSRFIEKTFCRITDRPSINGNSCRVISHIATLLDYSKITQDLHSSNSLWSANKAVSEVIFSFGPVIIRAILIVGSAKAGVAMWRPLSVGLAADSRSGERFILCETMAEAAPWIRSKGFLHELGGFDDPSMIRYTCDIGYNLDKHLDPSALMKDNFWKVAPLMIEAETKLAHQEETVCKADPNLCSTKETNSKKLSSTLKTVPCSGGLLTSLERIHSELLPRQIQINTKTSKNAPTQQRHDLLNPLQWGVNVDDYLRQAAKCEPIIRKEIPKKSIQRELIVDEHISRWPVNVCFWKGLGYSELRRSIDIERTTH